MARICKRSFLENLKSIRHKENPAGPATSSMCQKNLAHPVFTALEFDVDVSVIFKIGKVFRSIAKLAFNHVQSVQP